MGFLSLKKITGSEGLDLGGENAGIAALAAGAALGPAGFGLMSAGQAGLAVGGAMALSTGSLQKGIMAGLSAYGGAGLAEGLMSSGLSAAQQSAMADLGANATQTQLSQAAAEATRAGLESPFTTMGKGVMGLGSETGRNAFMGAVGGGSGLAKYGLAATLPIMAGSGVPTTTGLPTPTQYPGFIRPFSYDPRTQGLTPFAPVPTSRLYADGGVVEPSDDGYVHAFDGGVMSNVADAVQEAAQTATAPITTPEPTQPQQPAFRDAAAQAAIQQQLIQEYQQRATQQQAAQQAQQKAITDPFRSPAETFIPDAPLPEGMVGTTGGKGFDPVTGRLDLGTAGGSGYYVPQGMTPPPPTPERQPSSPNSAQQALSQAIAYTPSTTPFTPTAMTGDSAAAFNYLMGKSAYPYVTQDKEVFRPYTELVASRIFNPPMIQTPTTSTTTNTNTETGGTNPLITGAGLAGAATLLPDSVTGPVKDFFGIGGGAAATAEDIAAGQAVGDIGSTMPVVTPAEDIAAGQAVGDIGSTMPVVTPYEPLTNAAIEDIAANAIASQGLAYPGGAAELAVHANSLGAADLAAAEAAGGEAFASMAASYGPYIAAAIILDQMTGGAIGDAVGDVVSGVGGAAEDVVSGVGGALEDVGGAVESFFGGGGDCFLTTAAVEHAGEDDDGETLMALRSLRDDYLKKFPEGRREVEWYYRKAPKIVDAIDKKKNAHDIYMTMHEKYIVPTAEAVEAGDYEEAHEKYTKLIGFAKRASGLSESELSMSKGRVPQNIKKNFADGGLSMTPTVTTSNQLGRMLDDDLVDAYERALQREDVPKARALKSEIDYRERNPYRMATGGISDAADHYNLGGYSDGGRLLRGPGDGVSDDIPATIGRNRQPARLADGEFVVPARIVSELGNGSTEAGARKLYAMMDRIQAARSKTVGKGRVAKNTRADKHLPA